MKTIRLIAILVAVLVFAGLLSPQAEAVDTARVKGYATKKGKITGPHRRTKPNKKKNDNYGAKGNVNPRTGKAGTKDPFEIDKTPEERK